MFSSSARSLARWILLLPVVMVGSMLYWTLAIGLGAKSLMMASVLSYVPQSTDSGMGGMGVEDEAAPATAEMVDGMGGTILIHLEESAEPEDVSDSPGAASLSAADAP